jgi:hypothetical protein
LREGIGGNTKQARDHREQTKENIREQNHVREQQGTNIRGNRRKETTGEGTVGNKYCNRLWNNR